MRQLNYKHPFSKQRGVTLIEVLISIFLMAIIGLGSAFIAGRTAVLHRDQNVHLHTINQMRNQLESSQCITNGEKEITVGNQKVKLDCTYTVGSYTVTAKSGNTDVAPNPPKVIEVKFPALKVQNDVNNTFVPIHIQGVTIKPFE